jgi:hypothetical protein
VCRYLQSGNYPGQFPYGQGAAAAVVVAKEETTLSPPADQAVTGDEEEMEAVPGEKIIIMDTATEIIEGKRVFLPSFFFLLIQFSMHL